MRTPPRPFASTRSFPTKLMAPRGPVRRRARRHQSRRLQEWLEAAMDPSARLTEAASAPRCIMMDVTREECFAVRERGGERTAAIALVLLLVLLAALHRRRHDTHHRGGRGASEGTGFFPVCFYAEGTAGLALWQSSTSGGTAPSPRAPLRFVVSTTCVDREHSSLPKGPERSDYGWRYRHWSSGTVS